MKSIILHSLHQDQSSDVALYIMLWNNGYYSFSAVVFLWVYVMWLVEYKPCDWLNKCHIDWIYANWYHISYYWGYPINSIKHFRLLSNQVTNLVILGLNIFVSFLSLVAACVLSVGFARWCGSLLINAHLSHSYHLETWVFMASF